MNKRAADTTTLPASSRARTWLCDVLYKFHDGDLPTADPGQVRKSMSGGQLEQLRDFYQWIEGILRAHESKK